MPDVRAAADAAAARRVNSDSGSPYPFTFVGSAAAVLSAGSASRALTMVAAASNVTSPSAASALVNV